MATSTLPISNIINVTVTSTPTGVGEVNVNSLGLFTTEAPSNADVFREYLSASQVADDFGTNSVTTAMANNIFAQSPNILSGNGRLVIIPMNSSVSATEGTAFTADISGNLANFQAVSDGEVRITLNGANRDLTGLDFTRVVTLEDIANIIQDKLPDVDVSATTTVITFASKKVSTLSTVSIDSVGGGGTDISAVGFLDQLTSTETVGVDATGENLVDAIDRVKNTVEFVGVITNLDMSDTEVSAVATAVQSQDRIFVHHFASPEDIAGIATTVKTALQTKTRCVLHTGGIATSNLAKAAFAGRGFSVNTRGSGTAITMNLKQLANVVPDVGINQTVYIAADTAGMDLYVSYAGVPSVLSSGGNDYFDNVYMNLALKFALEAAGFNYLAQTSTKVPQTEAGMNGLKGAYNAVNERFIRNEFIGVGLTWNSSETFGNPEIFKENITNKGYYTYSLPIAQQDSIERSERTAPLVQIAIKRAGAIHTSDVLVIVEA